MRLCAMSLPWRRPTVGGADAGERPDDREPLPFDAAAPRPRV